MLTYSSEAGANVAERSPPETRGGLHTGRDLQHHDAHDVPYARNHLRHLQSGTKDYLSAVNEKQRENLALA